MFKKLTDEQINNLSVDELKHQLTIDKRNRFNYRLKVGSYVGGGIPISWIFLWFAYLFGWRLTVPIGIVTLFDLLCIYFSIRAYRKLVHEIRPQVAKLLQRTTELHLNYG